MSSPSGIEPEGETEMTLFRWFDRGNCCSPSPWPLLLALGLLAGTMQRTTAAETAGEWIALTGGPSLDAWQEDHSGWSLAGDVKLNPEKPRRLAAVPGDGVLVSDGDAVNFYTRQEFQDVELKCEFFIPTHSNSGVKLNGLYEIQIRDTHDLKELTGDMCGGVYPRAKQAPSYEHIDEGIAPSVNAAKPAGEWQTLQLTFYSPRFDDAGEKIESARFEHVLLNGKEIHKQVELLYPTGAAWNTMPEVPRGPLMLQGDHGPVAFRGIQIRPLSK
jgi:hypothetical protein